MEIKGSGKYFDVGFLKWLENILGRLKLVENILTEIKTGRKYFNGD